MGRDDDIWHNRKPSRKVIIYNPRQTVLITCTAEHDAERLTGNYDVFPSHWHMPVSLNPKMYAIAVNKEHRAAELIKESQHFVVNFMPYSHYDKIVRAGKISGAYSDKLEQIGLHKKPTEKIMDYFRLTEAAGWMECEVVNIVEAGDSFIFVGKVIYEHLEKDEVRPFNVKGEEYTTTR